MSRSFVAATAADPDILPRTRATVAVGVRAAGADSPFVTDCATPVHRLGRECRAPGAVCGRSRNAAFATGRRWRRAVFGAGTRPGALRSLPAIEPIVHLRTYYFDSESTSGKPTEAWALGGWLGLRTPWWGDFFQAGANYYLSGEALRPRGQGRHPTAHRRPGFDLRAGRGVRRVPLRRPDDHRVPAAHRPAVHQPERQPDDSEHVRGVHAVGRGRRRLVRRGLHHQGKVARHRQLRLDVERRRRHRRPGKVSRSPG